MSEAIVFTSGKGGVGKTTVISNIGVELSQLDKKVIMLDTDMGLRNLDLVMGIEDKVNYNILDILNRSCRIRQAIIRNKKYPNLYVIPAAPSMDTLCSYEARFKILIEELKASFDYCLIDSPAGIDSGFWFSVSPADRAIVVTTPHVSAIHDARRCISLLDSAHLDDISVIVNAYDKHMVRRHQIMILQHFFLPGLLALFHMTKVLSFARTEEYLSVRPKAGLVLYLPEYPVR